jgi:DNA-binding GntR family transcriptional regulator
MYTITALDTSVRSKSTGAAVAELVREAILCGEFAEGERLPESDLARRYGVSRIPLREALQILRGEGLVKASANRGVRVRALLPKEIDEIFCIRRLVEVDLVLESASRLTSQNIGEAVVAAELFGTSRTLRRDAELYSLFFDLLYEPASRAIEHEIARRLRLLVSKFEIPAYRSIPGSFASWAMPFVRILETGNRELSRGKLESFLTTSRDLCLKRLIYN